MDQGKQQSLPLFFLNATLIESPNHKVVIVLDRSPKFATSTADIIFSVRDDQNVPISGKLSKILWNSAIEAIVEFHRVIYDLFPQGYKQLRFVTSDYVGKFLTKTWSDFLITPEELKNSLIDCEPPNIAGDTSSCSIMAGLFLALEAISELTPLQMKAQKQFDKYLTRKNENQSTKQTQRVNVTDLIKQSWTNNKNNALTAFTNTSSYSPSDVTLRTTSSCSHEEGEIREQSTEETNVEMNKTVSIKKQKDKNLKKKQAIPKRKRAYYHIQNRGTIVVITSLDSIDQYNVINEEIAENILTRNESSGNLVDGKIVRVEHIDLFVLNISPDANNTSSLLKGEKKHPLFHSRLISVSGGKNLIAGIHKILQDIYELVSTTVVGIPMKEETQNGQSVNYNVEMLHPRNAHYSLEAFGLLEPNTSKMLDQPSSHCGFFSSVRLRWCTVSNKLRNEMFPILQGSFPITPAEYSNRAAVCLTTFILNGRNVMLEVFPDVYQQQQQSLQLGPNLKEKLISHYLSCDSNGSLIMHCVCIGERATLGGKLTSERVYGLDKCLSEQAAGLNRKALAQLAHAMLIQPVPLGEQQQNVSIETNTGLGIPLKRRDYSELFMQNTELTADVPLQLCHTFIYNIPEKFDPLLSIVKSEELKPEQFEECCSKIQALVAARAGANNEQLTDKTFVCDLFASGSSSTAYKDEQFNVAFNELCRFLQRFSCLSDLHRKLFEFFVNITGIRPSQPMTKTINRKRDKTKLKEEHQQELRIKRRKAAVATLWKPGEEINLYDWWRNRYEKEFWSNWKGDFEGHKKYGDKASEFLYPNLKLPQGQSKAAGTGTVAPIE